MDELLSIENMVFLAGLLHFCQIPAMIIAPRMLGWKEDLAKLATINRRIVQVMGLAIMITVIGLGVVVIVAPGEVVGGGRLGIGLTCFLSIFWLYRAVVQVLLYSRIWPEGFIGRLSHYGLSVLFFFLTIVYLAAFLTSVIQ